ncbi:MAG TPA: GYD domain-containing protein [Dehalococcoidia bacterium]|nr:GYD domain-containing protein [Dehalococcoidia bacterium]
MAKFLVQLKYSDSALAELVKHPEDRGAVISEWAARLGGNHEAAYWSFGNYDRVLIIEFPDNETMEAISLAIRSTGAVSEFVVTNLLTAEEGMSALRRATGADYHPPGAESPTGHIRV